ncbi:hypothetical protein MYX64_05150 [Nitrospinae bacterium AH_259_B05_G02_I21]|nr:hypothetical protein [Nitrospinae bacterium AH_259_B05_G02_I21]
MMTPKGESAMTQHPFERPGRHITVNARLEGEPQPAEDTPACPVCRTAIDLEKLEHSIRAKPTRTGPGGPTTHHLLCATPCFNDDCPVYMKLVVTLSGEEYETWFSHPTRRFDYTYLRDGRPITIEALADESVTTPPPTHCPLCRVELDLAALTPPSALLVSGAPLPDSGDPPQHRVTAYAHCPGCGSHLTCLCLAPFEELRHLQPDSQAPGDPPQ